MFSVLNTLSEYTYFYMLKKTSQTFLLVFKIVESLQCILEGYLRYKTIFCHEAALDAQLMIFFI